MEVVLPIKRARKARRGLNLEEKIKIITFSEKNPLLTHQDIASEFKVDRSTVTKVISDKYRLKENCTNPKELSKERNRQGKFPYIDDALLIWFKMARLNKLSITQQSLQAKALAFKKEFLEALDDAEEIEKLSHFEASLGWVDKFRKRFSIKSMLLHGESGAIDIAAEVKAREELKIITCNYAREDIYNADETGLYFRMMPSRTLAFKLDKSHGLKKDKERVSILLVTNCTGTYKPKLIVIGKSKKPRCLNGIKPENLPVIYKSSKKGWMNTFVFKEFLEDLNISMRKKDKKFYYC